MPLIAQDYAAIRARMADLAVEAEEQASDARVDRRYRDLSESQHAYYVACGGLSEAARNLQSIGTSFADCPPHPLPPTGSAKG